MGNVGVFNKIAMFPHTRRGKGDSCRWKLLFLSLLWCTAQRRRAVHSFLIGRIAMVISSVTAPAGDPDPAGQSRAVSCAHVMRIKLTIVTYVDRTPLNKGLPCVMFIRLFDCCSLGV